MSVEMATGNFPVGAMLGGLGTAKNALALLG